PPVLAQEGPEERQTAQPGHLQEPRGGREARARRSVLQAPLSPRTRGSDPRAIRPAELMRLCHFGSPPCSTDPIGGFLRLLSSEEASPGRRRKRRRRSRRPMLRRRRAAGAAVTATAVTPRVPTRAACTSDGDSPASSPWVAAAESCRAPGS